MDAEPTEGPTVAQLRRLMERREDYDKKKSAADTAKEKRDEAELEVYEAFEAGRTKSTTKDIGPPYGTVQFVPNETLRSKVYDVDAFEKWARENGYEQDMLGEPVPRKKVLNQYLRRATKNPGVPYPDGAEHRLTKYVTVTNK